MNKFTFFTLCTLGLLFSLLSVSAVQVGPSFVKTNYELGGTLDLSFTVINDVDAPYPVIGGYEFPKHWVDLPEVDVVFDPPKGSLPPKGKMEFNVKISGEFEPGENMIYVRFDEDTGPSTGGVSAKVGVRVPITLNVPIPPKYITLKLHEIDPVPLDGASSVIVEVTHAGTEIIDKISGDVIVLDDLNETVLMVPLGSLNGLQPGEVKQMVGSVKGSSLSAGLYRAQGMVDSDGAVRKTKTNSFLVGGADLKILSFDPLKVGGAQVPVSVVIENLWNEEIRSVVNLAVSKNGKEIVSQNFGMVTLKPMVKNTVDGFIDFTGLAGDYDLTVTAKFSNEIREETFEIEILAKDDYVASSSGTQVSGSNSNTGFIAIVGLMSLVIIGLVVMIVMRIKKKKSANGEE